VKKYFYSGPFQTYCVMQFNGLWTVWQDGVQAEKSYKRLKDAKKAIDNQEIFF